jgi:hypothetical protein
LTSAQCASSQNISLVEGEVIFLSSSPGDNNEGGDDAIESKESKRQHRNPNGIKTVRHKKAR